MLNISWRQHPTKLQFHEPIPDISTILRERRMRFAGHCWRAKQELASNLLLWSPNHGKRWVGRPAITYIDLASPADILRRGEGTRDARLGMSSGEAKIELCRDAGCLPNYLPAWLQDRDGRSDRLMNASASST